MPIILRSLIVFATLLAAGGVLAAEPNVVVNCNSGDAATADFKFQKVPSPSRTDAANGAMFSVLAGRRDANGAEPTCLNDGQLPAEADEPGANFFFAPGSTGGRLLVDLGKPLKIRRIATYSWHPSARGPQIYKLFASATTSKDFDAAKAGKAETLDNAIWKQLASVDTRPEDGDAGGQYGVSIINDSDEALGKYRYLLFDVSRTGGHQSFDQTFFSEIDVDDGNEHLPAAKAAPPVVDILRVDDKYEIAFDTTESPELKPWVDETLKPICAQWYPKIVEMLPSEDYEAPRRFSIIFQRDMRGVAYTGGRRIVCAAPWFKENLDGEAAGAVVHELVHVVQQYGRARSGERPPGWMVEGLADYIRWFLYEPKELRPQPNPDRAHYTDSYRTTAALFDFVTSKYDKDCVRKFNAAMRTGEATGPLWKTYTGKEVDELWSEYVASLRDR